MIAETIRIPVKGLDRTYTFMHISDAHIAVCDETADDAERAEVNGAYGWMPKEGPFAGVPPYRAFEICLEESAAAHIDALIVTGDSEDFTTPAIARYLEEKLLSQPYRTIYTVGNHEAVVFENGARGFCPHDGYPLYRALTEGQPDFRVYDYGAFEMISLDNATRTVTPEQFAALEREFAKQKPVILMMHVPIKTPAIAPSIYKVWGPSFMLGAEEDPDESGAAFVRMIADEHSPVIAIFCGHIHFAHTGEFAPGRYQCAAAPAFTGFMRKIEVYPAVGDEQEEVL